MYSDEAFRHLGLNRTNATEADVKRAYATRLKVTRPEDDPKGFMQLREALEAALGDLRWRAQYGNAEDEYADEYDQTDSPDESAPEAVHADITPANDDALEESTRPLREDHHPSLTEGSSPQEADAEQSRSPYALERHPSLTERTHPAFAPPAAEADTADIDEVEQPDEPAPDYPVDRAMDNIIRTLTGPWGANSVKQIAVLIDSADLSGIDEYQELSERLRNFLCDRTALYHDPKGTPRVPPWLSQEMMETLEQHFGWTRQASQQHWEQVENGWILRILKSYSGQTYSDGPGPVALQTEEREKPWYWRNFGWLVICFVILVRVIMAIREG